jgi:poly(A) polymerase
MRIPEALRSSRLPSMLCFSSALDAYFRKSDPGMVFVETEAGQVELAMLFENLEFPGLPYADASLSEEGTVFYFRCSDSLLSPRPRPFLQASLLYDERRRVFSDKVGAYPELRSGRLVPTGSVAETEEVLFEAAVLAARYGYAGSAPAWPGTRPMPPRAQRDLLELMLTGESPWLGLGMLKDSGFVEAHWPELAALFELEQSKEHHPEGDAWEHTLETFKYRKTLDLDLSLALLLHDAGKPEAVANEGRRFDRHAEIGAAAAARFLRRLEYPPSLVDRIVFVVRNHMLPAALPRIPLFRTQEVLESPLFPLLLEAYRCDESSTYRGPEGYYEACKAYRQYLKNVKNPYRSPDGKILMRKYHWEGKLA